MRAPRYGARAGVKNGEFLEKDSAAGRCTARAARPRCRGAARSGLRSRAEAHCRLTAPRRARRPRGPRTGGGGGGWRVARGRRRAPRTRVSQTTNVRNSKVKVSWSIDALVTPRSSHAAAARSADPSPARLRPLPAAGVRVGLAAGGRWGVWALGPGRGLGGSRPAGARCVGGGASAHRRRGAWQLARSRAAQRPRRPARSPVRSRSSSL